MPKKENKREEIEISDNELSSIKEEINKTKTNMRIKRSPTYSKIFRNLIIGILMIGYIYLLIVGYEITGIEHYFKTITILQYVLSGLGLIIIEISYQKRNLLLGSHGFEFIILGVITLVLVNLFTNKFKYVSRYEVGCIIFVTTYILVKCIAIRIIDYKREQNKKEEK